jgi:hypothetical protein
MNGLTAARKEEATAIANFPCILKILPQHIFNKKVYIYVSIYRYKYMYVYSYINRYAYIYTCIYIRVYMYRKFLMYSKNFTLACIQ